MFSEVLIYKNYSDLHPHLNLPEPERLQVFFTITNTNTNHGDRECKEHENEREQTWYVPEAPDREVNWLIITHSTISIQVSIIRYFLHYYDFSECTVAPSSCTNSATTQNLTPFKMLAAARQLLGS
jgi:hypothetical protein